MGRPDGPSSSMATSAVRTRRRTASLSAKKSSSSRRSDSSTSRWTSSVRRSSRSSKVPCCLASRCRSDRSREAAAARSLASCSVLSRR